MHCNITIKVFDQEIKAKSVSVPAVSFRFAKLPDVTESPEGREESDDNGFAFPDFEPYSDLN